VKIGPIFWILSLTILTDAHAVAASSDACVGLIPTALEEVIKQKFPEFRVPRQSDYDQYNYYDGEEGGTGCLGVATGSYFGDGVQSYAIILTSTARTHSLLVVGRLVSSKWHAQVLRDWGEASAGRTYTGTLNPGGLQPTGTLDGHRREPGEVARFVSNHQSIVTGAFESDRIVFFYNYDGEKWVHVRFEN
jgi:hypothetical protein